MKIQASNTPALHRPGSTGKSVFKAAANTLHIASGDQVRLSSLSDSVRGEAVESGDRTANVIQIVSQINAGSYNIPAEVVSGDIIQHSLRAAAA